MKNIALLMLVTFIGACTPPTEQSKKEVITKHLIHDYEAIIGSNVNVVVEIPTGSIEKWEVNKTSGQLDIEIINGQPRKVKYLGYIGNYGMIPQTILPKEQGGDGDPLDVIVLGPSVERGSIIKAKLIGVLKVLDKGEQDDKLIAVMEETNFYEVNTLKELNKNYNGVTEMIKTFFTNYKGEGKMEVQGFGDEQEAKAILNAAIKAYQEIH